VPGPLTLLIGAVSGGLVAAAAWRLLHSRLLALLAAVFFLSSPIVLSCFATDTRLVASMLLPVAWLISMLVALERKDAAAAVVAGLIAGLSMYVRPASLITMPLLAAAGAAAILMRQPRPLALRQVLWLTASFIVVAAPITIGLISQRSRLTEMILTYGLYDASRYNVLQGMREMFSWVGLVARSEAYWNYFDPAVWFFADSRVFLAPLAVPVALGLYHLVVPITPPSWLVISGLAVAAVPHTLMARPIDHSRLLIAAPFVALVATAGVAWAVRAVRR
jgi:hypothetical protein